MHKRVDQLCGEDMGKAVTIRWDSTEITGILAGLTHTADLVTDQALCQPVPNIVAGRITYAITIGAMHLTVAPDKLVTVDA